MGDKVTCLVHTSFHEINIQYQLTLWENLCCKTNTTIITTSEKTTPLYRNINKMPHINNNVLNKLEHMKLQIQNNGDVN
jgi:hypothetical protein